MGELHQDAKSRSSRPKDKVEPTAKAHEHPAPKRVNSVWMRAEIHDRKIPLASFKAFPRRFVPRHFEGFVAFGSEARRPMPQI